LRHTFDAVKSDDESGQQPSKAAKPAKALGVIGVTVATLAAECFAVVPIGHTHLYHGQDGWPHDPPGTPLRSPVAVIPCGSAVATEMPPPPRRDEGWLPDLMEWVEAHPKSYPRYPFA
jgi:hypothetical protein